MAEVQFPIGARNFSLLHNAQTGSGVYPDCYTVVIGGCFPEVKVPEGVKLTTHLQLVPMSKMVEVYLHSPIRLHGIVPN
jgi:hypothetical protein